ISLHHALSCAFSWRFRETANFMGNQADVSNFQPEPHIPARPQRFINMHLKTKGYDKWPLGN
ncbi:MAG: hypothetical protein ACO3F9_04965, partial [Burkholderiales bacterium]